jgi:solute carrier family 25 protein 16
MKSDEAHIQSNNRLLPAWSVSFLAGGIAGTAAKTSVAPLERIKILFQIRSKHYPYTGVIPTTIKIVQREGVVGLWKGNLATIVRIFPYAAIQFLSFEQLKKVKKERLRSLAKSSTNKIERRRSG